MKMIIDYVIGNFGRILPKTSKVLMGVLTVVVLSVTAMTVIPAQLNASAKPAEDPPVHQAVNLIRLAVNSEPQQNDTPPDVVREDGPGTITYAMGGTCIQGSVIDVYHQSAGAGWVINANAQSPQTTGPDGSFGFSALSAGTYQVEIQGQDGWRAFTPPAFEVLLSGKPEDGCAVVRYKMEALPCLTVKKQDKDGQMGLTGLVGLADWGITVKSGSRTETRRTNADGLVEFRYLEPGVWSIEEEAKLGWMPAPGQVSSVDLISPRQPKTCVQVDLVNQQLHTSCIKVIKEVPSGYSKAGWEFALKRKDGTRESPPNQFSDEFGNAYFYDLNLGEWTVTELPKPDWKNEGPDSQTLNLTEPSPSSDCEPVTFKNVPIIRPPTCDAIGYKINHFDQGLDNWLITATDKDGSVETRKTDESGRFEFKDIPCGTWTFKDSGPADEWRKKLEWQPVTPDELVFTLAPDKVQEMRFKNMAKYACIKIEKYDNVGIGLSDWPMTVTAQHDNQQTPIFSGKTGATGFVLVKVMPGDYFVTEGMLPMWEPTGPVQQAVTVEATGYCGTVKFINKQIWPYGSDAPVPGGSSGAASSCSVSYTVRSGDSLYSISQTYGVTVDALRAANKISGNLIFPGNTLCIP